jgi:hypothetical protein
VFGALLWLTSQLVVMPFMAAGFFSAHIGGLKVAVASLLGHLVYGCLLGLFPTLAQEDLLAKPVLASPLSPNTARPEPKPRQIWRKGKPRQSNVADIQLPPIRA